MVLHEDLPGPYRTPPGRAPSIGTLPFDDSIPSRSELRSRGFFKTLEKAAGTPRPGPRESLWF